MLQNSTAQIISKLKNSNCEKAWKLQLLQNLKSFSNKTQLKLWPNTKTQIVTKLKTHDVTKLKTQTLTTFQASKFKNSNSNKTIKINWTLIKPKNWNCDKTQNFHFWENLNSVYFFYNLTLWQPMRCSLGSNIYVPIFAQPFYGLQKIS